MAKRADGEGTISKRNDGRWEGKISLGYDGEGKRIRRTVYGRTQGAVKDKLERLKNRLGTGMHADTGLTVSVYLERWLEEREGQLKPRTQKDYRYTIKKYIVPRMGRDKLATLTPLKIQALVSDVAKTSGARTANLCRSRLYTALKQAVRWQIIPRNPVEAVDTVKEIKREMIIWTPEEAVRFLDTARPHRLYALFYLVMATGLRHNELLQLSWDDLKGGVLFVRESKTAKGVRRVGLSKDVIEVLEQHRQRQEIEKVEIGALWPEKNLVFPSMAGTKLMPRNVTRTRYTLQDRAQEAWRKDAEAQGDTKTVKLLDSGKLMQRARLHDLRHFNVSIRRKQGQDPKLIADQIGHTDPAFTLRLYTHLFEEDRAEAGINLSEALGSNTSNSTLN